MPEEILVVDDETEIADLVELYLKNENFAVCKCYTAAEALRRIDAGPLDLAILDVMLPGTDGFALCRHIRESYAYPVVMLTAKDGELDEINGLALGADDYIAKPFRPLELVARVKAQLRRYKRYNTFRSGELPPDSLLTHAGLSLNVETHECSLNERPLPLTPTEFSILRTLLENRGKVLSAEELFHRLWADEYYHKGSNSTITVHIRHLREKLGDSAEEPKYIKTVWGVGYKIDG